MLLPLDLAFGYFTVTPDSCGMDNGAGTSITTLNLSSSATESQPKPLVHHLRMRRILLRDNLTALQPARILLLLRHNCMGSRHENQFLRRRDRISRRRIRPRIPSNN